MNIQEADERLSNMSHDDIVKSWLYYRNSYYHSKEVCKELRDTIEDLHNEIIEIGEQVSD